MRRVPANSSSPVTLVPLSKNPDTWSDCLRRNFMSTLPPPGGTPTHEKLQVKISLSTSPRRVGSFRQRNKSAILFFLCHHSPAPSPSCQALVQEHEWRP